MVILLLLLSVSEGAAEPSQFWYALGNPQIDVFVIQVVSVEEQASACRGDPGGELIVRRVVRGQHLLPGSFRFCLTSEPGEGVDQRALVQGSSWIVLHYVDVSAVNSRLLSLRLPFIPYSDANLATVDSMAVRDSPLLKPLGVSVLLLSLAAIVLFLTLRSSRERGASPRVWASLRFCTVLSAGAAILAYWWYEKLMSPYYDIRIDVLVLWPLLGFALLAALGASLLRPHSQP